MNNKKIVLEIIVIPLCVMYLFLILLKSSFAAAIIFAVFAIITAVWFVPKYIEEIYIYKSKLNFLKIIFVISYISLAVISILNIIFKLKLFKILFIIFACISFIGLLYFGIKNIKTVMKQKKDFAINILYSFSSFTIFAIMLSTFIVYLK